MCIFGFNFIMNIDENLHIVIFESTIKKRNIYMSSYKVKVYDKSKHDIRSLDFDNKFKPYYNVDILDWDYKNELNNWIPDYIHSSPVCKEFSKMKTGKLHTRDMNLGLSLLHKSLEILEYVKSINSNLIYTLENPKGLMRKQECMKKYDRYSCSYCMYGFQYL